MDSTRNVAVRGAEALVPDLSIIVERLVRQFNPTKIVLFGSHARGDARPDSDVDLLVVLPRVENKHRAHVAMLRALGDLTTPVDIVITTPDELAHRGHVIGPIFRPALRDGSVLYESA